MTNAAPVAERALFDAALAWRLHPQVALRDEAFGALAYHYGNRRLGVLKSRALVELVRSLEQYGSAADAIDAIAPPGEAQRYRATLARLCRSEVIDVR